MTQTAPYHSQSPHEFCARFWCWVSRCVLSVCAENAICPGNGAFRFNGLADLNRRWRWQVTPIKHAKKWFKHIWRGLSRCTSVLGKTYESERREQRRWTKLKKMFLFIYPSIFFSISPISERRVSSSNNNKNHFCEAFAYFSNRPRICRDKRQRVCVSSRRAWQSRKKAWADGMRTTAKHRILFGVCSSCVQTNQLQFCVYISSLKFLGDIYWHRWMCVAVRCVCRLFFNGRVKHRC